MLYAITVPPAAEGQRIDAFLRHFLPELSAPALRGVFSRRDVKLDGRRVKPDARVRAGQAVQVYCMEAEAEPLPVVYEDGDVLLLNKRAGLSVEPDARGGVSLIQLAAEHLRRENPAAPAPIPCHRLDNQTSGLILFAKNDRAATALVHAFRVRSMDKRYICLVRGTPKPPAATCRAWLVKDAEAARVRVVDHEIPGSRPILTAYETLEAGDISRLRVHLLTGRTHQIRAHLAALGHPLLGDDVYGDRALNREARCQGKLRLCAVSLTIETGGALPQLDGRHFEIDCPF